MAQTYQLGLENVYDILVDIIIAKLWFLSDAQRRQRGHLDSYSHHSLVFLEDHI